MFNLNEYYYSLQNNNNNNNKENFQNLFKIKSQYLKKKRISLKN